MVRHAEHPFLHHQGFRAALRRDQRQDGARGGARSLRPAAAAQRAMVVLEHVRRAGRVPAEPGGEEPVGFLSTEENSPTCLQGLQERGAYTAASQAVLGPYGPHLFVGCEFTPLRGSAWSGQSPPALRVTGGGAGKSEPASCMMARGMSS